MSVDQVQLFREAIEPFISLWRSIDLRVIAHISKESHWLFSSVRAVLDHQDALASRRIDLPSIPRVLVAHERWEIGRLDELLASVSNAELKVKGEVVQLKSLDGQSLRPMRTPSFGRWDRARCRSEFGIDFASFVLRGWESISGLSHEDIDAIEAALRCAEPPWDGLVDIRENFVRYRKDLASNLTYASFEVVAPLGLRLFQASDLEANKVLAIVETSSPTIPKEVSLSVIAKLPDGAIERIRHPMSVREEKQSAVIPLPKEPSKASLILTYGGLDVDRMEFFRTANPRFRVLEELGAGTETLWTFFEEARGRPLEDAFALLLHLLGFSPAHYGATDLDAPDIVAYPDVDTWLLVVECTGQEPELGNKMTKLASRAKRISQATGLETHRAVVTTLPRSVIGRTDLEKATAEDIAIISRDEVRRLIQMIKEGAKPIDVRDYLAYVKTMLGPWFEVLPKRE